MIPRCACMYFDDGKLVDNFENYTVVSISNRKTNTCVRICSATMTFVSSSSIK